MAFDASKDVVIEQFEMTGEEGKGLRASISSYDGGEPKFQIGPRFYTNKAGEVRMTKVGRLTGTELDWLLDVLTEVKASGRIIGTDTDGVKRIIEE